MHGPCAYAGYLVRFVPSNKLVSRFAFYFTKSAQFEKWLQLSVIQSTIGNVNAEKYANMELPLPLVEEQRAIADFLDRKTAQIDALIAKKQRLIELLQEKRSALISHAITKGLDLNVPMKDSGVEWLGKVPRDWDVLRLGAALRLQRGHDLPENRRQDGPFPVVSSSGASAWHSEARARGPGVVTGRYGTIGKVFYVEEDYWPLNTALYVIDFKGNHPKFASYLLMNIPFDTDADKSAVPGVNRNHLHTLPVALPTLREQSSIARYLDDEGAKIGRTLGQIENSIAKLREYRAALISAAVTGKIDVREER